MVTSSPLSFNYHFYMEDFQFFISASELSQASVPHCQPPANQVHLEGLSTSSTWYVWPEIPHLLLKILIIHLQHLGSLVPPLASQSYSRPFWNSPLRHSLLPGLPVSIIPSVLPSCNPTTPVLLLPHCHTSILKIPPRSHCYQTFNRSPLSAAAIQTTGRASQLSYRQPTTLQSPLNTISPPPAAMLCPQVCSSAQSLKKVKVAQ